MRTAARKRKEVQRARSAAARARIEREWRERFEGATRVDKRASMGGTYRAAAESRGFDDWMTRTASADIDTLPDRDDLVARSRDLFRNNPFARALGHTLRREVVGRGMKPQAQRSARALGWKPKRVSNYAKNVSQIWEQWAPDAMARGGTIYEAQGMIEIALVRDGECFVQFLGLPETPHRPYRLAIDVIEAHRVSTPTDRRLRARSIRDGIELNSFGMPVAIWVEVEDLEESMYFDEPVRRPTRSRWRRIPIYDDATGLPNIAHVRNPERPSTRDVPMLAGALDQVHVLGEFIEAELLAKKAEGCIAAAITSNAADGNAGGMPGEMELEPGMIARLLPGESINFLDPKRPGGSFGPFVEFMLRSISFSAGLPYEVGFIAFAGMNYSNARTTILAAQRYFEAQQDVLIERFLRPAFCRLLWEAWQRGDLKVANWPKLAPQLCTLGFQGQGWKWVDPEKEAKASALLLENKLTSRSMALKPHGVNFEEVIDDLVYEEAVLEEAGMNIAPPPAEEAPQEEEEAPEEGDDGEQPGETGGDE